MDSLELVKQFLTPYLSTLNLIIVEAWEEYHKSFAKNVHKLTTLAPSVIMSGLVVNIARKYFDGDNTVEIKKNSHSAIFIIRSPIDNFRVDLRFKKLDRYYKTHNAKSGRNTNFVSQVYEPYLGEEFKPIPQTRININAGFQINETWDKIEAWITCPNGSWSYAWKFKIKENELGSQIIETDNEPPAIPPTKRTEPIEIPETQKNIKGIK